MTLTLMAVRQEVNNFESSVVVQELEFARLKVYMYEIPNYDVLADLSEHS